MSAAKKFIAVLCALAMVLPCIGGFGSSVSARDDDRIRGLPIKEGDFEYEVVDGEVTITNAERNGHKND